MDTTNNRKKFSESLYRDHDSRAVQRAIEVHWTHSLTLTQNQDRYGPDCVLSYSRDTSVGVVYVEVEVKRVWRAGVEQFPWPTIQLPQRKGRYTYEAEWDGSQIDYWVFREDLRKAVVIPGETLENAPLVEIPNVYVPQGELFYRVPVSVCWTINTEV